MEDVVMNMKVVRIEHCGDCPYYIDATEYYIFGDSYCGYGKEEKMLGKINPYHNIIPDWCPLEDG